MSLRRRSYLIESARRFTAVGRRGKHDPLGIIFTEFYRVNPELEKSLVGRIKRQPNRFTATGSWPSSGRQVFDWELVAWGERGGDVIIKLNLWSAKGVNDGITYRTSLPVYKKVAQKFRIWFQTRKMEMKNEVAA